MATLTKASKSKKAGTGHKGANPHKAAKAPKVASGAKTVRVTKTGNSRALPLPAEAAKIAGLDVGDTVVIEVRGGDVIYRHGPSHALVVGEGAGRAGIVPRGRVLAVRERSSFGALDTWDF